MAAAKSMPDRKRGSHLLLNTARKWLRCVERPLAKFGNPNMLKSMARGSSCHEMAVSLVGI